MSLRDLKRRIRSIKLTKKITRAIQMVAASKVKNAQEKAVATRLYRESLLDFMHKVGLETIFLPGMKKTGKNLYIVFTSDRGLCGSYNSALLRYFYHAVPKDNAVIICIGKKGFSALKGIGYDIVASYVGFSDKPTIREVLAIAKSVRDILRTHDIGQVNLVHQKFLNAMMQRPEIFKLLPGDPSPQNYGPHDIFEFEPSKDTIISTLKQHYLVVMIYQSMLEATASEHSARMVAMEQASSNASDLIFDLTQSYNTLRQAAITKELIEIVSGSQS